MRRKDGRFFLSLLFAVVTADGPHDFSKKLSSLDAYLLEDLTDLIAN